MTTTQRPASTRTSWSGGALRSHGRTLAPFVAVTAAGLVAATTLAAVDPNEPGHYPTCPFLASTGLFCPGCGALRAVHALLTGDAVDALARNPLAVLAVPYLLLAWGSWGVRSLGLPVPRSTSLRPWVIWALLAVVLVFGVLRNLPGWTWLSPA